MNEVRINVAIFFSPFAFGLSLSLPFPFFHPFCPKPYFKPSSPCLPSLCPSVFPCLSLFQFSHPSLLPPPHLPPCPSPPSLRPLLHFPPFPFLLSSASLLSPLLSLFPHLKSPCFPVPNPPLLPLTHILSN